jgi:hypothetical protein
MLLLALTKRGIAFTDDDRRAAESCAEQSQLEAWFTKALRATSITEVLAS